MSEEFNNENPKQDDQSNEFYGFVALSKDAEITGDIGEPKSTKIIKYTFDRYVVTIEISSKNEFLGITEIQLNKDFRNYKQKKESQITFDVEQYYFEE